MILLIYYPFRKIVYNRQQCKEERDVPKYGDSRILSLEKESRKKINKGKIIAA